MIKDDNFRPTNSMKTLWNYIRFRSSRSTSPSNRKRSFTPILTDDTYPRLSIIRQTDNNGENGDHGKKSQRGSSMPETMLLGLLSPAICAQRSTIIGRQRNSAPNIIPKDKTEKTWERLLKMKSNEKKVKRKTSRLMFQNWLTNDSCDNANDLDHQHSNRNGNNNNQQNCCVRSNVVVIIDSVSPTKSFEYNHNDDDNGCEEDEEKDFVSSPPPVHISDADASNDEELDQIASIDTHYNFEIKLK
ncbi:hypothetical protein BLOT_002165 [Blomia tropicalis]|nr:hypothetical protein BLOT_002165 [Blomia tropicalis]